MALKISLKPGERLFLGGAAVANGRHPCELTILNNVQVLREREIMREEEADTPCKRLYLLVQLMYMDPASLSRYQELFIQLAEDILRAAPSLTATLAGIGEAVAKGDYYPALKRARGLVQEEAHLLERARAQPAADPVAD